MAFYFTYMITIYLPFSRASFYLAFLPSYFYMYNYICTKNIWIYLASILAQSDILSDMYSIFYTHSIWDLTFYLALYLTYIMAFYLEFYFNSIWQIFWHSFWHCEFLLRSYWHSIWHFVWRGSGLSRHREPEISPQCSVPARPHHRVAPCSMNSWSTNMLQVPLKRQLPAPKWCK